MEKIVGKKINTYISTFKNDLRNKAVEINLGDREKMNEFLEFVMEYQHMELDKADFAKRRRTKNAIPDSERCVANISSGEQCTRRKKDGCAYCGTHAKGAPHGSVSEDAAAAPVKKLQAFEVVAEDINGIVYYVDAANNVFRTEDVVFNRANPEIIGKVVRIGDTRAIPEIGVFSSSESQKPVAGI